ncbi:MAG TPA: GNAT family N-acetyltransferase [Steroidobacteraceae bacterium]|nr:GNAT family N-acetyltransferase [Steroidobacteraceae bacterium]
MTREFAPDSTIGAAHRVRMVERVADVSARDWNRLAGSAQPFLRHEFLAALEESGCVAPECGWAPRHLIVEDARGSAVGAMPLYLKSHSRGEFVFDFAWANAYHEHGLRYYPKLVAAVPFTPANGARLLTAPAGDTAAVRAALIGAATQYMQNERLSSWHALFPLHEELETLERAGLIRRLDCQFHWHNRGYASFDEFLASFTAEKRKKAKRERRRVAEAGIRFETLYGEEVGDPLWERLYEFYADTFHRHGHEPYLNLEFFRRVAAALPHTLMLKVARLGVEPIAVAMFFVGADVLYGRYWGADRHVDSLHFETCYYQGIDYCIEHGLARFEPGTQGEHKVPRGFVPVPTGSAHRIADPRFEAAIRDFAAREARSVRGYIAAVDEHVPYRRQAEELRI